MIKKMYACPRTDVQDIRLEASFLEGSVSNGQGTDLSDPYVMTDDDFDSIFG